MFAYLAKQSKPAIILYGTLLAGLVSLADLLSGGRHSVLILYTLPVCLVAWFAGRRAGASIAALCAFGWLAADSLGGMATSIAFWDAVTRCGVFVMLALFTGALAESTRRRDQLLQFIVHDLRSPLTNVLTGLETLRALPEQPTPLHAELTDMATVSARRVLTLVNSLLDLPQLEHHSLPISAKSVAVTDLLQATGQQVNLWARQDQITVECVVDEGVSQVYADPDITARVLVNLTSNALKFSPTGSVIRIRAAHSSEAVIFSVQDEGPGIPREWLSRVFDPYAQVTGAGPSSAPGTGLGLTFCRLAVAAQKGRIWIESEVGRGTTVLFSLPAHAAS
ncbi:MAG: ATP-binding protein [Actinomycetota bacterium]